MKNKTLTVICGVLSVLVLILSVWVFRLNRSVSHTEELTYTEQLTEYSERMRKLNARYRLAAASGETLGTVMGQPVAIGGTIEFGCCEQDNERGNAEEPIRWIVVGADTEEGFVAGVILISEKVLDVRKLNTLAGWTSWGDSELRQWLNGEFYDTAFTKEEKKRIFRRPICADEYPIDPENTTFDFGEKAEDSVTLPNKSDALHYFMNACVLDSELPIELSYYRDDEEAALPDVELTAYAAYVGEQIGSRFKDPAVNWYLDEEYLFSTNTLYVEAKNSDTTYPPAPMVPVSRNNVLKVRPMIEVRMDSP